MVVFQANNVTLNLEGKMILDNVSFQIQKGTFTTLIGPNGAGKSTLLKLMLGFVAATSGQAVWSKHHRLGYVPQKFQIDVNFPLTVGRLFDLKPGAVSFNNRHYLETLTKTDILKTHMISELSGGELQRVLLAYALLGNPDVVLLDEPMQGLDIDSESLFLEILNTLKEIHGKTIFMVSHDLHMVFKHSDHVICLQNHVCCQGLPTDVQESPAYHNLLGHRTKNLMALYTHDHDHSHHHRYGDHCNHD